MNPERDSRAIFRALGVLGTYDDGAQPRETYVIVERDVQVLRGRSVDHETHISVRHTDDIEPQKNHEVTVNGDTWTLARRVTDDGHVAKFAARPK